MKDPKPRRSRKIPVIRRPSPPGTAPGTLAIDPSAPKPRITIIGYGPEDFGEAELESAADIAAHRAKWPVLWINVDGLGDKAVLQQLGDEFKLHRLALEDVLALPWIEGG